MKLPTTAAVRSACKFRVSFEKTKSVNLNKNSRTFVNWVEVKNKCKCKTEDVKYV
jgi:hypothetical protein